MRINPINYLFEIPTDKISNLDFIKYKISDFETNKFNYFSVTLTVLEFFMT